MENEEASSKSEVFQKKISLRKIFLDYEDQEFRTRYFFYILLFFISCLILAQLLFPEGYTIKNYYISDQGSTTKNPIGCWFFIIGAGSLGILTIPHIIYIYHRINEPDYPLFIKLLGFFYILSGIIACLGLSIVGFVPNSFLSVKGVHDWAANFAFGGFGASIFFAFLIDLYRMLKGVKPPSIKQFLIFHVIVICVGTGLIFQRSTIQQWFGLYTVLTWLIGKTLVVKSRVK